MYIFYRFTAKTSQNFIFRAGCTDTARCDSLFPLGSDKESMRAGGSQIRIFGPMWHWFNKKTRLPSLFLIVFFLHSCLPTTSFKGSKFCPSYLKKGDQILVNALADENWEYYIGLIRKEMKGRGVSVLYAPEEEWNLRAAGITNPLDTLCYTKLTRKGITHLLLVREVNSSEGDSYDYKTPYELGLEHNLYDPFKIPAHASPYKVELLMHLVSLETKQFYSFRVDTQVNGAQVRDDDGGQHTVNAGSLDKARNVAIKKGVARIAKYCR
jgi:hypothetical protein